MASVRKREWTSPNGEKKTAWVVTYTDQAGKRRLKTFERKKEADAWRLIAETEVRDGTHVSGKPLLVREVADLFIKRSEERVDRGEIGKGWHLAMVGRINKHIVGKFGGRAFADLKFAEIEEWCIGLETAGRGGHRDTAKAALGILARMERFALKRGFIKTALCPQVSAEVRWGERVGVRTFDIEDLGKLLSTLETRPAGGKVREHAMFRCMVQLAVFGGLRYGEIMATTLDALDLDAGIYHVRHNLTGFDELKGPKTKSGLRDVPLPRALVDLLRDFVARHYVRNDRRLVFRIAGDRHLSAENFHQNYWRPLLKRAGLSDGGDRHHFHALRHFNASALVAMGVALPDVAALLGHRHFDITLQVYTHAIVNNPKRQHEAVEKIAFGLLGAENARQAGNMAT